jgi:hypothetical protein
MMNLSRGSRQWQRLTRVLKAQHTNPQAPKPTPASALADAGRVELLDLHLVDLELKLARLLCVKKAKALEVGAVGLKV